MKFESKLGIGEIVCREVYKGDKLVADELYEVVGIGFDSTEITITVRHRSGQLMVFKECELEGDPEFNQETGYPND